MFGVGARRLCVCAAAIVLSACSRGNAPAAPAPGKRVGVLLVNHGSRSAAWRNGLLALEAAVRTRVLSQPGVVKLATAFMEYTEPSIATQLRAFDAAGVSDVVLVPVFLTVSTHSFDDIPTIVGKKDDPKSRELMRVERIERYTPRARVHITPLLDFTELLSANVVRRVKGMSRQPADEGVVLIAYGDQTYEREWSALMEKVGGSLRRELGIDTYAHGWCGHLVHYDPKKTTVAIETVLAKKRRALVVPILVAHDEMFQIRIIGGGIERVKGHRARVVYRADAILPDPRVESWVVETVTHHAAMALGRASAEVLRHARLAR
jgi:sirohydrochlorin ferrochelatase